MRSLLLPTLLLISGLAAGTDDVPSDAASIVPLPRTGMIRIAHVNPGFTTRITLAQLLAAARNVAKAGS